jgi:hypothetical protein
VNYTGGLQEGGPKRVENLVSVTSSSPDPATRAPCTLAVAALACRQNSPLWRQLIGPVIGCMRCACRAPLSEIWATAGVAGMNAREDRRSSGMLSRAITGPLVRKICTNPSSHTSRLAMGGLVPRLSKRSSLTLGEYRKAMQTLFANMEGVRLLAPARSVTKMISCGRPRQR